MSMCMVRCFCGKVINPWIPQVRELIAQGMSGPDICAKLNLNVAGCCWQRLVFSVDVHSQILDYEEANRTKPSDDTSDDFIQHLPRPKVFNHKIYCCGGSWAKSVRPFKHRQQAPPPATIVSTLANSKQLAYSK